MNVMTAADAAGRRLKMKAFSIDAENNITVYASADSAPKTEGTEFFSDESALAELAATWQGARLIEIFNSLPGMTPVKKFKDRATAVSRIWKAIQTLGEATPAADEPKSLQEPQTAPVLAEGQAEVPTPAAPQARDVTPEEAPANKDASPATDAPASAADAKLLRVLALAFDGLSPGQQEAKWTDLRNALATRKTLADAPRVANPGTPRDGSKISQVIEMLKREGGTTLEEIMSTMDWQKHTTRAMLSAGGSLVKKHGLQILSEKVGDKRVYSIKA
jgi:hypothetical protein